MVHVMDPIKIVHRKETLMWPGNVWRNGLSTSQMQLSFHIVAGETTIHGFREALGCTICILLKMGVVMQSIIHFIDLCYYMDYSEVK